MDTFEKFISDWKESESKTRAVFIKLKDHLQKMEGVTLDFKPRPGVTYSLRPKHANQTNRNLFAMIDVIDDDPTDRWLSVCFYEDMISDPDGVGDLIPGGLLGSDGYCFDIYEYDVSEIEYLKHRLDDAYKAAKS